MTSILEALRELEEERRRGRTSGTVSVADAPVDRPASAGLLYPLIAGLAVGVLVVGIVAWWIGVGRPSAPVVPGADDTLSPTIAAVEAPRDTGLSWLERADPPQARVESDAPAGERTAAIAPSGSSPSPAAATSGTAAVGRPAGIMTVESIRFVAAPERRSVTLRLDGRRVTLRQGERAAGVEVQLILEDGVYLNRGSDVVFAVPEG